MNTKLSHWVFGSVIVALAIGYVIGQSLPDYQHTIHRQIFADNLTTTTLYLFVAWVYWRRITKQRPTDEVDRHWTQLGVIGTFITWSIHRLYWGIWRHLMDNSEIPLSDWWRDSLGAITSLLQLSIWIFAIVMIWPTIRRSLGIDRWWAPFLAVATTWLAWFGLQAVI